MRSLQARNLSETTPPLPALQARSFFFGLARPSSAFPYVKALRPHQWVKNSLVIAPAFFALRLDEPSQLGRVILGFISFSLVASFVYVTNDMADRDKDRLHPRKRFRPIASGAVPLRLAWLLALACGGIGLCIAALLSPAIFVVLLGYLLLNLIYSRWLKNEPVIDLLAVTSFYVIRVIVGGMIVGVGLSSSLLLTTFFLSLFLVTIKRRQELVVGTETRKVLNAYSKEFLDVIIAIGLACSIFSYALYSSTKPTLFSVSLLFVVYGLLRYLHAALGTGKGEEPDQLIASDKRLWAAAASWLAFVFFFFYFH